MPQETPHTDIRAEMLALIEKAESERAPHSLLQTNSIITPLVQSLGLRGDKNKELAVIVHWNELFRTGYLGWGVIYQI